MTNGVLYFPSIRVPESQWFARVLLYWDEVGTIVPAEYLDDPQFLRPYTAGLKDHGLLKFIPPDSAMWNARAYYNSFLSLVDSLRFDELYPASTSQKLIRVHVDKTGYGLANALEKRKLASFTAGQEWDAWFDVEEHTANLLMAYLASILGQSQEPRMNPITDSGDCLRAFTMVPTRDGKVEARLDGIRTEVLADLLPAPIDYISPGALAEFKGKHKHLLTNFRTEIETRVVLATAIENPELRARSLGLLRKDLKGQLDEITRRMQEHKWQRIGLGTLLAVTAAGLLVADAAGGGGALSIAGNSLGLTSAVYAAFEGTRTPKDLLSRPMAYGALAHRELGRKV
jgi:hypothetical protein